MTAKKPRKNHMSMPWHEYVNSPDEVPIKEATFGEKATFIGRCGLLLLSSGAGAWRVRGAMVRISTALHITCSVDVGLTALNYSCFDGEESFSQSLNLVSTAVNTTKLTAMEHFAKDFPENGLDLSVEQLHNMLDEIEKKPGFYTPLQLGLASGLACCGFTFLLGGGPIEMILAFFGAAVGNFVRMKLIKRHLSLFLCVAVSVSAACLTYFAFLQLGIALFHIPLIHEAGYICAMLFIIPGFPFITSGIDLAKSDMRSGLERLAYAIIIIAVATLTAWILALILGLKPANFMKLGLSPMTTMLLRLVTSVMGVFGFSIMFNSSVKLAGLAALIGCISNTLRLELVDLAAFPPAAAAFCGAFCSGILASIVKKKVGYPRICITVPSIVIMVPGLYLYRGIYNLGATNLADGGQWLITAALMIAALPLGLIFARMLTDTHFRHCT